MKEKVSLPLDKRSWRPSPLMGQIVLVTSLNEDGRSNVAPKSWLSMMAFEPPLLVLGCNLEHWTAANILARREFVINIPADDLAEAIWKSATLPHPRTVEDVGLTPLPSRKVSAPLVAECRAHLECTYVQHLAFGSEVMFVGEIVAASADRDAVEAADPYAYLRLLAFLEDGTYGVVEASRHLK